MDDYKEVNFSKYCDLCVYREKKDYESPCNECLEEGMREGTEKPLYFEERKVNATNRITNTKRTRN